MNKINLANKWCTFDSPTFVQYGNTVMVSLPGFSNRQGGDAVLSIDMEKGEVTNVVTGDVLSIATARPGYVNRPRIEYVPSESDETIEYMVVVTDPEDVRTWTCSCQDFKHRRSGSASTCKHIGYVATGGVYRRLK